MTKWNGRVFIYKATLIFTYLIFLVYALAFSIPMWLGKNKVIIGLWAEGLGDSDDIDDVNETGFGEGVLDKDWWEAVRALMMVGMACYFIAILASFMENFCVPSTARDYGVSGAFVLMAGLCGAAAIIVTVVELEEDDKLSLDYLWGYILAVVASGLAILLALVLLISRNQGEQDMVKSARTADYVYAHKQGPFAPEYNNPGYRGDELPLVNGVPYHQHHGHGHGPNPYNMYRGGHDNGFLPSKYDHGPSYHPYGYKESRPGNRASMAESADLSNGFTPDIVHGGHSLQRPRADYGRSQYARGGEYYYNGSRPF